MDFSKIKEIVIPEGKVKKIMAAGKVIWQKVMDKSGLPSEYQEVEYIKADSTVGAYINLGFTFDTAATVKIGLYLSSNFTAAYPFGAAENSGTYRFMITSPYDGGAYIYGYGSTGSTYQACRATGTKDSLNEVEYTLGSGKVSVSAKPSGSSVSNTTVAYTMTSDMYLFAQNYNGTIRYGGERQIHYFQYYDKSGTLICDLVPCYRKSDRVIGMYDIVRKIFLTNTGSGSFTKGADVSYKNWVLYSTEADGVTIYNGGLGYKNGYRVRSGGEESATTNASCTGYIPVKGGDIVNLYGWKFEGSSSGNSINVYNAALGTLGQASTNGDYGTVFTTYKDHAIYANGGLPKDSKGVYTWIVPPSASGIVYIRISGYDATNGAPGQKMIVTINEPIT